MAQLYLIVASVMTLPGLIVRLSGTHPAPLVSTFIFGLAVLGSAFMLSWAAEVAQKDISQALAVAFLALIAVLPEYAVDMYFAWAAAENPEYGHYATANMTGANRLLVGFGWPVIVLLYALRHRRKAVKLEPAHRSEILFLGLATLYSVVIPLKGRLDLFDTFFLVSIFAMYAWRAAQAESHEPDLVGPAKWIGEMPVVRRRSAAITMFVFSGTVIFLAAEPFAESLVGVGRQLQIDEFLLVQWLAPLASEAPEFIIAILWTLRGDAESGLAALVSSKVNQWTLLMGTIPLVFSLALGHPGALALDLRQEHEIWLTAAQSLFAVTILANLSLSWYGALALLVLFLSQLIFENIRMPVSAVYVALAVLLIIRDRKHYPALFRDGFLGTGKHKDS